MPLSDDIEIHDTELSSKRIVRRRNPQAVLSEDASLEEHGEFILYYYNHSIHGCEGKLDDDQSKSASLINSADYATEHHCTEEAVKFAGLCRALRTLPSALRPQQTCDDEASNDDYESDETEIVYLTDSTLIFVPLELNGDVVAIAQIPRSSNPRQMQSKQHNESYASYGADPAAIRDSLRRCHALFTMVYGGGIHRRLSRTKHLEMSDDWCIDQKNNSSDNSSVKSKKLSTSSSEISSYCYGGMKELFQLRRDEHKISISHDQESLIGRSSQTRTSNLPDAFDDKADESCNDTYKDQIDSLLQILPVTSLRKDIKTY